MFYKKKNFPFVLAAFSIMLGLTLPMLLQDGMFMDATLYTAVAKNMSEGFGTFWYPQINKFDVYNLGAFHEQPPLVFWIQSLFFRLLGGGMYTERIYTLLMLCLTSLLIVFFWRRVFTEEKRMKDAYWLPVLLWVIIPICWWSYQNNMHENTMGVFTLLAVIFIYEGMNNKCLSYIKLFMGGIFIFLASLSKGVPGFFPLVVPVIYWLVFRKEYKKLFSRSIIALLIALLVSVVIYSFLLLLPESSISLQNYFFKRLLHRIGNDPTVGSRFTIIGNIITEILMPVSVCIVVLMSGKKLLHHKYFQVSDRQKRLALFFILTGIAASAPLMLTKVQKSFYFVPSLPFFGLGLAALCAEYVVAFVQFVGNKNTLLKSARAVSVLLFIAMIAFCYLSIGKTKRDEEILRDIHLINKYIPPHTEVYLQDASWYNWQIQCYMVRYNSFLPDKMPEYHYGITEKSMHVQFPEFYNYRKVATPDLNFFEIWEKTR